MSEKHDEANDEKFLRDLFERLKDEEKSARLRIIILIVCVFMGVAAIFGLLFEQRKNMPDEFLLMKLQENVEQHNKPIRDSIEHYLSRMPESDETRKLRLLVN